MHLRKRDLTWANSREYLISSLALILLKAVYLTTLADIFMRPTEYTCSTSAVNDQNRHNGSTVSSALLALCFHRAERIRPGTFGGVKDSKFACCFFLVLNPLTNSFRTPESDGRFTRPFRKRHQLAMVRTSIIFFLNEIGVFKRKLLKVRYICLWHHLFHTDSVFSGHYRSYLRNIL